MFSCSFDRTDILNRRPSLLSLIAVLTLKLGLLYVAPKNEFMRATNFFVLGKKRVTLKNSWYRLFYPVLTKTVIVLFNFTYDFLCTCSNAEFGTAIFCSLRKLYLWLIKIQWIPTIHQEREVILLNQSSCQLCQRNSLS